MPSDDQNLPQHLDPSPLGTKEYWEAYYQDSTPTGEESPETASGGDHDAVDEEELESWFSESGAPEKVLSYLTDTEKIPLDLSTASILDVGTGNGSMLFQLVEEGAFNSTNMVGIDYSPASVKLARKLAASRGLGDIRLEVCDVLAESREQWNWVPDTGFDLVMDKGTFDAMSLSDQVYLDRDTGKEKRICERYPGIVADLVKAGGWLMITSCNWTEDEVVRWFTVDGDKRLKVWGKVEYPKFRFGGVEGQEVASVCFRKAE